MPRTLSTTGPRPRAVIYTRVSQDKREGRSVAEQEADCRRDAEREGWHLVQVLSDNGVSASRYSKKERPNWIRLLGLLRRGEVDVVVFWEMSRGTRHRREWAEFAELAEDRGLHICVRGRVYDARDPHDMAYLDNLVTRGVEESGETRERIMRAVTSAAEQGRAHSWPGFGHRTVYDPETGRPAKRVADETAWGPAGETPAGLVREAAARVLAGEAPWTVAADFNRRGVPSPRGSAWALSSLRRMLMRSSIMGRRSHRGRLSGEGGWQPLIRERDYWALQERLAPRPRIRDADAQHLCSGIAVCGVCGTGLQFGRNGKVPSYKCFGAYPGARQACVSRAEHLLDEAVEAQLFARFDDPDVVEGFRARREEPDVEAVRAELAELRAELEEARAAASRTGPGRLPTSTLLRLEAGLGPRVEELEALLRPSGVDPLVEELASDPRGVWAGWSTAQKRKALRQVTVSIRVLKVGRGRRDVAPWESAKIRWAGKP